MLMCTFQDRYNTRMVEGQLKQVAAAEEQRNRNALDNWGSRKQGGSGHSSLEGDHSPGFVVAGSGTVDA